MRHEFPDSYWKNLRCPTDPGRRLDPDVESVIRNWDDRWSHDRERVNVLGAYAGRDWVNHPLALQPPGGQWLVCDRCGDDGRTPHHEDGIVVGFDDGTVRLVTWEELGVEPGGQTLIGPGAAHPEARKMTTIAPRKR